jgi:phosphoribosylpyrophosphate synthetase
MQHTIQIDKHQKQKYNSNMKILNTIKNKIIEDMIDRANSMQDTANHIIKTNNHSKVAVNIIKSFIFKRCFY